MQMPPRMPALEFYGKWAARSFQDWPTTFKDTSFYIAFGVLLIGLSTYNATESGNMRLEALGGFKWPLMIAGCALATRLVITPYKLWCEERNRGWELATSPQNTLISELLRDREMAHEVRGGLDSLAESRIEKTDMAAISKWAMAGMALCEKYGESPQLPSWFIAEEAPADIVDPLRRDLWKQMRGLRMKMTYLAQKLATKASVAAGDLSLMPTSDFADSEASLPLADQDAPVEVAFVSAHRRAPMMIEITNRQEAPLEILGIRLLGVWPDKHEVIEAHPARVARVSATMLEIGGESGATFAFRTSENEYFSAPGSPNAIYAEVELRDESKYLTPWVVRPSDETLPGAEEPRNPADA